MKRVLFLELRDTGLAGMYSDFLHELEEKCDLVRAKTVDEAIRHLVQNPRKPLSAILVWEPTIMASNYSAQQRKENEVTATHQAELRVFANAMVQFTKNGGITVFGGPCGGMANGADFENFFPDIWSVPWQRGDYLRAILEINKHCKVRIDQRPTTPVLNAYSSKAQQLSKVAKEDLVYVSNDDSYLESMVFSPEKVTTIDSGPAVFAQYSHGRLGYLGNVNNEIGSQKLLFAMLGL